MMLPKPQSEHMAFIPARDRFKEMP
jgi:hypothetical protein